jgi:hypothetical protein
MQRLYFILIILTFFAFNTAKAQVDIAKAQAMFIYNFSRLIQWPLEYRSGDFVIGVLGQSDLSNQLETYTKNKKVGFQEIVINKYRNTEDIEKCHVLFVSFGKTNKMPEAIEAVSDYSTLVITEKRGAIEEGSAINFLIVQNKLKFEFKPENATNKDLKVSSKLKEMAMKIYE